MLRHLFPLQQISPLHITCRYSIHPSRLWAYCFIPPRRGLGLVKLNIDGYAKGNPGVVGAGGILRDSMDRWLLGFYALLSIYFSVVAELEAIGRPVHGRA